MNVLSSFVCIFNIYISFILCSLNISRRFVVSVCMRMSTFLLLFCCKFLEKKKKKLTPFFFHGSLLSWKIPAGWEEERRAPVEVNLRPLFCGATGPRLHCDLRGPTNCWSMTCCHGRGYRRPHISSQLLTFWAFQEPPQTHIIQAPRRRTHTHTHINVNIQGLSDENIPITATQLLLTYNTLFPNKISMHLRKQKC